MKQHQRNIIIVLLVVVILALIALVLYDYYRPFISVVPDVIENYEKENPMDLQKLESDYKNELSTNIIPEFKALIESISTTTSDSAIDMRQHLLNLKLPEDFKDLHVQLVLLLDLIEDDIESRDLLKPEEYQGMLDSIVGGYEWIK